jgi:hypothetical protein
MFATGCAEAFLGALSPRLERRVTTSDHSDRSQDSLAGTKEDIANEV